MALIHPTATACCRSRPGDPRALVAGDPVDRALRGLGQPQGVKRSHEAGFARHLIQPFAIEDLDTVIQEFLVPRNHSRSGG